MGNLTFIAIGLVVGLFSGFFGLGGGVILVPILILIMQFAPQTATATSLAVFLFPVGALAVYEYWRAGKMSADNFKMAAFIAVGIFLGAFLGSKLALMTPEKHLKTAFGGVLIAIGVKLLFGK